MTRYSLKRTHITLFLMAVSALSVFTQGKAQPVDEPAVGDRTSQSLDSPIRIEKRRPTLNGETSEVKIGVFFYNTTQKPIRAFAWLTKNNSGPTLAVSLYNKGHRPDLVLLGSIFDEREDPQVTFDWVLFTDGSTWGPDERGSSREILGYFKGFHAAVARAADLVDESDSGVLTSILDGPWQTSWSIELPPKPTRGEKEYFGKGYEIALSNLQSNPELAQLDLPKRIFSQLRKELKEIKDGVAPHHR